MERTGEYKINNIAIYMIWDNEFVKLVNIICEFEVGLQ